MKQLDKKKLKEYSTLAFTVLLVIALMYVSGIGCPIRYMTGIPCPGCGMSRACVSLILLDFEQALRYHPMVYAMPIFVVLYIWARHKGKSGNAILWIACALFIITYLIRILIFKDAVLEIDIRDGRIWRTISRFWEGGN